MRITKGKKISETLGKTHLAHSEIELLCSNKTGAATATPTEREKNYKRRQEMNIHTKM